MLPLSLRSTFLRTNPAGQKRLLKKRLYAYPAAAFDPLLTRSGGKALLVENAFTVFQRHVKTFAGCAARLVKVGLAQTRHRRNTWSIDLGNK
jgi:hypothetical protein